MTEIIKKAERLFEKCTECVVASVTEGGYPRICVLKPLQNSGIREFYFSTGASSEKVAQFIRNDKAGVTFYSGGDSVTLTGRMEIVGDKSVKDGLWRDFLGRHFPDGGRDDPEYCIIRFISEEAKIYITDETGTVFEKIKL